MLCFLYSFNSYTYIHLKKRGYKMSYETHGYQVPNAHFAC